MGLEWDENKNRENLLKHGFDFTDAGQLFENPILVIPDIRKEYEGNIQNRLGQN
jgi:uncharacterized protein